MARRSKLSPEERLREVQANALDMIRTLRSLVDRMNDLQQQTRDVQKQAEDVQVAIQQLAKDTGASWPEIGAVTDESGDAVRVRAQRRRTGQG